LCRGEGVHVLCVGAREVRHTRIRLFSFWSQRTGRKCPGLLVFRGMFSLDRKCSLGYAILQAIMTYISLQSIDLFHFRA
jgi:hypothetical protein